MSLSFLFPTDSGFGVEFYGGLGGDKALGAGPLDEQQKITVGESASPHVCICSVSTGMVRLRDHCGLHYPALQCQCYCISPILAGAGNLKGTGRGPPAPAAAPITSSPFQVVSSLPPASAGTWAGTWKIAQQEETDRCTGCCLDYCTDRCTDCCAAHCADRAMKKASLLAQKDT